MSKLLAAAKWAKQTFENPPNVKKIEQWVRNESVPGRIIDGEVFVLADDWAMCDKVEYSAQLAKDDSMVDKLLG